jgi:hypothetical protein
MTFSRMIQASLGLRPASTLAATLSLGLLAGCGGGGGGGFDVSSNALSVTSTAITEASSPGDTDSQFESADPVDWVIPLTGGCGGPYVIKVVNGSLPPGISALGGMEGATKLHNLRGTLLQHGNYSFKLEITDTACVPFEFTTADFAWNIEQGLVSIVTAEPTLHPPGTYDIGFGIKNPLYDALPDTVFGSSTVVEFVIAGGTPPYTLDVVNDPNNPDDEDGLPLGISIPPFSRSLVGAPLSLIDGEPYIFSLVATDANGQQTAPKTIQWEITAPPIIFLDSEYPDGKCGEPYFMELQIKDGVPPFNFRLVQSDVQRDGNGDPDVVYQSPNPPIITPATCTQLQTSAAYPAQNNLGPDYRSFLVPPEGLRFGNDGGNVYAANGALAGIPRRRGDFAFYVYCFSTTAPTASGQHNWKYFELSTTVSEPPNAPLLPFNQNPGYTQTGVFTAVPPYAPIADAEVGVSIYNPDAGYHAAPGLLLRAEGGVRKDGLTDAPNASQLVLIDGTGPAQEDGTTPGGGYDWTVNPNPPADGDSFTTMPPGMALDGWSGIWRVANSAALVGQQAQALEFTVQDQQLPIQVRNSQSRRVSFAVGPDKLIITESTYSGTSTTSTANRRDMHDYLMTVKVCMPYSNSPAVVRALELSDLTATHVVPPETQLTGTAALANLLTNQDILRVAVNASGWWDDVHNLNSTAARPGQHADNNWMNLYYYGENDFGSSSDYSRQPSATCVDVPAYRAGAFNAVTHNPAAGVFTDGGRLYPFANGTHIGFFMIRSNATIYVPFALSTAYSLDGLTFDGFGEHMLSPLTGLVPSQARAINMTFSPDGRFAAVKLKDTATNYTEGSNNSRIVIFSLTGEKVFGGQTWTLVRTGATSSTANGVYLYGASLVMTNSHLYYLCGNRYGTFTSASAQREHYIYRYQFANASTGASTAGTLGTGAFATKLNAGETQWTNTTSQPMQTRFHLFYNPWSGAGMNNSAMTYDTQAVTENSLAPLPFRVSYDGRAISILAMPDVATTGSTVNADAWHVWVDFQGTGAVRLSANPMHVRGGGSRGYVLGRGSANTNDYENWHAYSGPTTHMEISDDGTKVAVVANRYSGAMASLGNSYSVWYQAREDVIAYRTSTFTSWTEFPVTGDNLGTNIFSAAGGMYWHFGALTFTKDNNGLVFWGGYGQVYGALASSTYNQNFMQAGTLYGTNISSATSITGLTVTSLLATSDGGSSAGITNYTTSSPYNPTVPNASAWDGSGGVIKPMGGFISRNRNFLYIMNKGSIQGGGADHQLIGVNIRSVNTATNINGRTDFRGFSFSTWPQRRGFVNGVYVYYPYYGMYLTDYPPYRKQGGAVQVMCRNNGRVFFGSLYQSSGPGNYLYATTTGGPTYTTFYYDYSCYGGEIEMFDADVAGPFIRISNFGGDTSYRRIHFVEPTSTGDAVGYVIDNYAAISNSSPSSEQLYVVRNIQTNASTGALTSSLVRVPIETTSGRVGDSFSFGANPDRLYYAYGGAGNENQMTLKEASITQAGALTLRTLSANQRRWNVLFAQR